MKKFISIILLLSSQVISAQTTILDSLNFYGSFRVQVAFFDKQVEVQNNASRIGIYLQRGIAAGISGFGKLELGTNLVANNTTFNPDAATVSDESWTTESVEAITTRLGFVGLKHPTYGALTVGKQWSVYYDVTEWTDRLWIFGGLASGTYNTGNDGGTEGTGRAENAVIYRNAIGPLSFGGQAQFNDNNDNYGASAVFKAGEKISVGAAFNTFDIPSNIEAIVDYNTKRANSYAGGIKYAGDKLYAALVYSYNQSEIQYPGDSVVAFPGNGAELKLDYYFTPWLMMEAGSNVFIPTETPEIISNDFRILQFYLGGAYFFRPDFLTYVEFKLDEGVNTSGDKPSNVFVIGLRYNFSFARSQIKAGFGRKGFLGEQEKDEEK